MNPYAFISYRRSDAAQTARALHFQLRLRFGSRQVFMDVSAITAGEVWPDRLRRAIDKASVVLAVIGPSWLTAVDQYGRRRLDDPRDWVHQELHLALWADKPIIPLRVGHVQRVPPAEALPVQLVRLSQNQDMELRDEQWDYDVRHLCEVMTREYGFLETDSHVIMPSPAVDILPLTRDELEHALFELPRWEPVETTIVRDYPNSRHELRRAFRFASFEEAIAFMSNLAGPMSTLKHHPRLENVSRGRIEAKPTAK